jgi:hypothetical protein
MMRRTLIAVAIAAGCLLSACAKEAAPDARAAANPEKYSRDRDLCLAQSDEYMRDRRRIEDGRAATFANDQDRGRSGLATQMANYGDSRSSDKFMASCMEARGWPQAQKSLLERIRG